MNRKFLAGVALIVVGSVAAEYAKKWLESRGHL
jgi:hypothetical protein